MREHRGSKNKSQRLCWRKPRDTGMSGKSQLPTVTQVLAPFCDFSRIPEAVLAHAAERGTIVHHACACRLLGLWHPPVPEEAAGYVRSFELWAHAVKDVVLVEGELSDPVKGYAGHPDLICVMRGDTDLSIPDFKTPAAAALSWKPQLAAYRHLGRVAGHDVRRTMSVRLKKDGGHPIVNESTATADLDFNIFLNALACWKYFNPKGG